MTREERNRIVRDEFFNMTTGDAGAIDRLLDAWEDDVDRVRQDAIQEGREVGWFER